MSTTVEVEMSIKDIALKIGYHPRTVNLWRNAAEDRLGRKLGRKLGKVWYFGSEDVREILKSRELADSGTPSNSRNFREKVDFSQADTQAESDMLGGMDAIVASGDQNALAVGAALGQRWNQLMWTAAIQEMQSGMVQMQQQFDELHQSVAVTVETAPQLPGSHLKQLEGAA